MESGKTIDTFEVTSTTAMTASTLMAETNFSGEATTTMPTTIPEATTTVFEVAKDFVSAAVTTDSTHQTSGTELDDYYYYDYADLERHEAESNRKYVEQLSKISSILSRSTAGLSRENFPPGVYVNQYKVDQSDLFVENPQSWDPLENFLSLVVAKVYLVVPAFVVGIILGVLIWSTYLMVNKCVSNAIKGIRPAPEKPGREFLQVGETRGVSSQTPAVVVTGKRSLLKPAKVQPSVHLLQGSSSTSSGVSSSSSTPVPFESASEGGRNPPSTTNSSMRSKNGIPEVLKAVDNLVQTVESAVVAARVPSPSVQRLSDRQNLDFP